MGEHEGDDPSEHDVPVDVPAASIEDEELPPDFSPYRKIWRGLLIGLPILALLIGLHVVATDQLHAGRVACEACLERWDQPGVELERCCPATGRWASWWPVTRRETVSFRRWADYHTELAILQHSARIDLDAEARDAAATRLLRGPEQFYGRLDRLVQNGAHAIALEALRNGLTDPHYAGRHDGVALLRGELELYTQLGRAQPQTLERAAWLCLHDPEAGRAALLESLDAAQRDAVAHRHLDRHRLALVACAGSGEILRASESGEPRDEDAQAWFVAHEAARGQRLASAWLDESRAGNWAPVLAQAVLHEPVTAVGLVAWIDSPGPDPVEAWLEPPADPRADARLLFTPEQLRAGGGMVTLRRDDDATIIFDPAGMLAAAQRLATLADTSTDETFSGLLDSPTHARAVLRHAAAVLAGQAALEWIARGELELAGDAARTCAATIGPDDAWLAAGLRLQTGDAEGVLAWLERERERVTPSDAQAQILTELELRALVELGRRQQALERVEAHFAHARPTDRDPSEREEVLRAWRMLLELEVRGSTTELEPRYEQMLRPLPWYARHIANPDLARRDPPRVNLVRHGDPALSQILLAAVAHDPAHEEVWLDAMVDLREIHRSYLWARAEAARWRGHSESEHSWRTRLDAITELADTEDRAMLLHIAGL